MWSFFINYVNIEKEDCAKYYNSDRKFGFLVERGSDMTFGCKPFFSVQKI